MIAYITDWWKNRGVGTKKKQIGGGYCTQIESTALRCDCSDIMIAGADENFLEFRRYIQRDMAIIVELKRAIEEDLGM